MLPGRRSICLTGTWLICAILLCAGAIASPPALPDADGYESGSLHILHWRVDVWFEEISGVACWLRGPAGELRAEIALNDGVGLTVADWLPVLLQQKREGWSCTTADHAAGTFNRWGGRWQKLDGTLVDLLRVLTTCLDLSSVTEVSQQKIDLGPTVAVIATARTRWLPDRGSGTYPALGGRPHRVRLALRDPTTESSYAKAHRRYRRTLVLRGRGRGDAGEILSVVWLPSADATDNTAGLVVTSSRRAGKLTIVPERTFTVQFAYPETFAPLWKLDEMLRGQWPR